VTSGPISNLGDPEDLVELVDASVARPTSVEKWEEGLSRDGVVFVRALDPPGLSQL
jgi:hypothetical protein